MDSIFRVNVKGEFLIHPDAVKLVPQFAELKSKQVVYLVLAYDSANTIFKQQPISLWKTLAAKYVFGHDNVKKIEDELAIKQCSHLFQRLVYDEDRIYKARYLTKIRTLNEEMLKDGATTSQIKQCQDSIGIFKKLVAEIDNKITANEERILLANKNGKLSLLEEWQRKLKWKE